MFKISIAPENEAKLDKNEYENAESGKRENVCLIEVEINFSLFLSSPDFNCWTSFPDFFDNDSSKRRFPLQPYWRLHRQCDKDCSAITNFTTYRGEKTIITRTNRCQYRESVFKIKGIPDRLIVEKHPITKFFHWQDRCNW